MSVLTRNAPSIPESMGVGLASLGTTNGVLVAPPVVDALLLPPEDGLTVPFAAVVVLEFVPPFALVEDAALAPPVALVDVDVVVLVPPAARVDAAALVPPFALVEDGVLAPPVAFVAGVATEPPVALTDEVPLMAFPAPPANVEPTVEPVEVDDPRDPSQVQLQSQEQPPPAPLVAA